MPRWVRAGSRAPGEPITKAGIAPILGSASQSTNIVLPVLGSPSLQCHIYPELAVSAVVPAGMRLCFCAGGEQMEQPGSSTQQMKLFTRAAVDEKAWRYCCRRRQRDSPWQDSKKEAKNERASSQTVVIRNSWRQRTWTGSSAGKDTAAQTM